ncbi:S8 family peptidase [Gimesia aquarii]|uniref:Peptidase S8/S53 domain-containing protein n=1 Tax=Gimesia aquarii TaxID=2527964 RepID=A0A517W3Q4_9PLAN|nr:S8 family peptidase [Gimesia aquarii]QDT99873.1 hypothetical protein V144x_53870 [Gimesia aquarii]
MAAYKHIVLDGTRKSEPYTSTWSSPRDSNIPPRPERTTHGKKLLTDLTNAKTNATRLLSTEPVREGLQFIPMKFVESSNFEMEVERLESSKGIQIVSVNEVEGRKQYIVAVPDEEIETLQKKFEAYLVDDTRGGNPQNEPLASGIDWIRSALLADYWTGDRKDFPTNTDEFWWEVWLEDIGDENNVESWFRSNCKQLGIPVSEQSTKFPDRIVVLAFTTFNQWKIFPGLLNFLTEFRRSNLVAGDFLKLTPFDQSKRIEELLSRTTFASQESPSVCILDTGINRGHPLLEHALRPNNTHTVKPEWNSSDHCGHGTELAGLALYGPLNRIFDINEQLILDHQLESVKILPPVGSNDPPDYGPITVKAMEIATDNAPNRSRVFSMAVTAGDKDFWRPTLWSASIDQACAGVKDGKRNLFIVSTGNLRDNYGKNYPDENHVSSIEDPSQSWNALTVGAYTDLIWSNEEGLEGYSPIAHPGSLSPTSRTSLVWEDRAWPYKPDVVFEGGNDLKDDTGFVTRSDDLELLTTQSSEYSDALLGTTRDSSAATAQIARMAVILQAEYPKYWPETIRGLIVHSADWTNRMINEFPRKKRDRRLRVYGMGVPDLEKARQSANGFTTMVIQDVIQPFCIDEKNKKKGKTNEMHLHDLPLPQKVLEQLGNTHIRMRVTLSYFVEPNPPRRGYVAKYHYASHGLRFSVRRPQETPHQMRCRLSREFWPQENRTMQKSPETVISDDRKWDLGEKLSNRGSIHSDTWVGTAAELASSNLIGVYPVSGWWRYKLSEESVEKKSHYALIVTISTDDTRLKLYDEIKNEIDNRLQIKTKPTTEIEVT